MPSQTLCIQVGQDDGWTCEGRAEVGGRARVVATLVANLEPPGKALEEVADKGLVRGVRGEGGGGKREASKG